MSVRGRLVTGSVKHQQPMRSPVPQIFFPHAQWTGGRMWITLRTSGDPTKIVVAVRGVVRSLDGTLPLLNLRTMEQVIADSLSEPRLLASCLASFAGFAIALASMGIYGLIAYAVAQRTHEFGVRIALGASCGKVLWIVIRKGALLAVAGALIGVPPALAASKWMGSLLYGMSARDPTVFMVMPAALIVVALAASYLPARGAGRVNPVEALRQE